MRIAATLWTCSARATLVGALLVTTIQAQAPELENSVSPGDREIHRLRVADQNDLRGIWNESKEYWDELARRQAERTKRVKEIYRSGDLITGGDYFDAALVLQHGNRADDYLLAHVLCTVAIIKGNRDAPWLCAATLDRYLQSIQRPQVFGTQYDGDDKKGFTYEPYDSSLLTDSVREVLEVPTTEQQKKNLANLNHRSRKP